MGHEVEAKMRSADHQALADRIAEAGGERGPVLFEVNTYFDTPEASLRQGDQALRIRIEKDLGENTARTVITYKGPKVASTVKSRPEHEFDASDADEVQAMFEALGYTPALSFEKRRERWHLDHCHIELDRLPGLGDFVEIEGPDEAAVLAVREKIGLADEPMLDGSYVSMLAKKVAAGELDGSRLHLDAKDRELG